MEHQLLEFNVTRVASLEGSPRPLSAEGGLVREVVISTEKPVRTGGGIARAAGAVLAPYLRNPVVMWAHNYKEPPVAKATALQVEPGVGISAKFEFPAPGVYPLADVVRGLWDGGFINAASIGFAPLEWEMIDDPESIGMKDAAGKMRPGKMPPGKMPMFTSWELYEFSLVAVPRDREAVRRAFEFSEPLTVSGLQSDNEELRRQIGLLQVAAAERLAGAAGGYAVGDSEAGAILAAAAGASILLDLQRLLDGLTAVKVALHA